MSYQPGPFRCAKLYGHMVKESRPLNKTIRVLPLYKDNYVKACMEKFPKKNLMTILNELAEEWGFPACEYLLTIPTPKRKLDSPNHHDWDEQNGDEILSIALEGKTYSINEEITMKLCKFFETDPNLLADQYPASEW